MRACLFLGLTLAVLAGAASAVEPSKPPLPAVAEGWRIELVEQAPRILFPTAVKVAPDGTIYLGQDPMDMPGPPTVPIDSVVTIKDGKVAVFADKLWSVMGLEWIDGKLYVVHAPYLSTFEDTDGDGRADRRVDLITGLGPRIPGFSGINDHVASGIKLGMDGFLYLAVGDKGIPRGVGKDGATIQLHGGGVIRVRPDGTGLEVVSTGERNPLSAALSATDDVFTFGNDDDSKKWPNSLVHHIVGGHYGYPYQFLTAPWRTLPIMAGHFGGSGAQGVCYNEDGLPAAYRGNLFFCDWGLQTVFRYEIKKLGGTFTVTRRTLLVTKGAVGDFRPFSLALGTDGASLLLADWAFNGWLAQGPRTGRLYRLSYEGKDRVAPVPRPQGTDLAARLTALDHPSLTVRLESQRILAGQGAASVAPLAARLRQHSGPESGRIHALWALDAVGVGEARPAIRSMLRDASPQLRLQAARSAGIRKDAAARDEVAHLLADRDPAVRREAAIALGRLGDAAATPQLFAALGDPDRFAAWSVRQAIRRIGAWDKNAVVAALLDERRREAALALTDEVWSVPVVEALIEACRSAPEPALRQRLISNLAGQYLTYPEWSGNWFGTNPLAGEFPRKTEPWSESGMKTVLRGLVLGLADRDAAVRYQSILGLGTVGADVAPILRAGLVNETDPRNQAALIAALGAKLDAPTIAQLSGLLADASRPEQVRTAALEALARYRSPDVLRARLTLLYDPKTPPSLAARALPPLARDGILPPNDVASFLESPSSAIRASALLSLSVRKILPDEVKQVVLSRLDDPDAEVRKAAIAALGPLQLREAIPRLAEMAARPDSSEWSEVISALCAMPDPRAVPAYLRAIEVRDPRLRRAGERALLAIRDQVERVLIEAARTREYSESAALTLERVLAQFDPVLDWRVIGPFPRTTARVFVGEPSINFAQAHTGAEGRSIVWAARPGETRTGRVILDDFKKGVGDRGGFGYDTNGSPDLCAFGYAEIESDRDRLALMLAGSSGRLIVTLNEQPVYQSENTGGRAYAPDTDLVRIPLRKGKNRLLVASRQGLGAWSFSIQVSRPSDHQIAARTAGTSIETLTRFAMTHRGDPRRGEELFFDPKGIGCARCHKAGGRGTASIGPDLTGMALKYDRAEIIRSVLDPSNRIATGYQPVTVATRDGKVITGLVRSENGQFLELADAEARITRVSKDQIEERGVANVSVMPGGLVETLSPVEFSDLVSYLESLKPTP